MRVIAHDLLRGCRLLGFLGAPLALRKRGNDGPCCHEVCERLCVPPRALRAGFVLIEAVPAKRFNPPVSNLIIPPV